MPQQYNLQFVYMSIKLFNSLDDSLKLEPNKVVYKNMLRKNIAECVYYNICEYFSKN